MIWRDPVGRLLALAALVLGAAACGTAGATADATDPAPGDDVETAEVPAPDEATAVARRLSSSIASMDVAAARGSGFSFSSA